jgi:hypothetical protein
MCASRGYLVYSISMGYVALLILFVFVFEDLWWEKVRRKKVRLRYLFS